MTINKEILMSSIVPVNQHGRQGLCYLNLSGMAANHLYSLIWQPRLALLSYFSFPDNERHERLNLRSRRLVVVFPAKANLLVLAIFKQRIPISGWFYNSTVISFLAARE